MKLQRIVAILKRIFKQPPIPTLFISIPSFVFVIYVLANNIENMAVSYAAYTLSAYALIITITGMADIICLIRQGIKNLPFVKRVLSIPLFEKYVKEEIFRTETSLYQGLFINLLYVVLKFCSGIYYQSIWFGALAVYYFLLAVMRFSLLHYVRSRKDDRVSELKRYRFCGIVLLFMNQALVSMLSLETAMLAQFGGDDVIFRRIMTSATGAGVCIIVLGMAFFMIVKSTKVLKNINQD